MSRWVGQWVGLKLTFIRVIVKVLSDQVKKTLTLSREVVCVLSKESQGSHNAFILHQRSCFAIFMAGKSAVNHRYYIPLSVFYKVADCLTLSLLNMLILV